MWSVGVILFQMLTGFLPFPAQDIYQLRARVKSGKYQLPDDVQLSNVCLNLIQSLIRVDPA
jgi:serine/threonine protein kinase